MSSSEQIDSNANGTAMPASVFELQYTARRLRKQISRAHKLTERLTEQAADRTLDPVDRESAATRAKLCIEASQQAEKSLALVEEALQ